MTEAADSSRWPEIGYNSGGLRVVSFGFSPDNKETQMTLLNLSMAVVLLTAADQPPDCSLPQKSKPGTWVFTNADLARMAACRGQTNAPREDAPPPEKPSRSKRGTTVPSTLDRYDGAVEADWRARWRSVDQKVRKLREDARELRQEASEAPHDPKKQAKGRRSPSLLIGRAISLENEARRLEDEFQESARREGALPGWLRPREP